MPERNEIAESVIAPVAGPQARRICFILVRKAPSGGAASRATTPELAGLAGDPCQCVCGQLAGKVTGRHRAGEGRRLTRP